MKTDIELLRLRTALQEAQILFNILLTQPEPLTLLAFTKDEMKALHSLFIHAGAYDLSTKGSNIPIFKELYDNLNIQLFPKDFDELLKP